MHTAWELLVRLLGGGNSISPAATVLCLSVDFPSAAPGLLRVCLSTPLLAVFSDLKFPVVMHLTFYVYSTCNFMYSCEFNNSFSIDNLIQVSKPGSSTRWSESTEKWLEHSERKSSHLLPPHPVSLSWNLKAIFVPLHSAPFWWLTRLPDLSPFVVPNVSP